MKYRKKTEFVDAIQFDGTNGEEIEKWADHWIYFDRNRNCYVARTCDDVISLRKGDYVIKHVDGCVSICLESIFEAEYEAAKNLSFSEALIMLKAGHHVRRSGWKPEAYLTISSKQTCVPMNNGSNMRQFICMCNMYTESGGKLTYSWAPISPDMFADDWEVVP